MANAMAAVALNTRSASRRCNGGTLGRHLQRISPKSEGHAGGALGVAETLEAAGHLLAGVGG